VLSLGLHAADPREYRYTTAELAGLGQTRQSSHAPKPGPYTLNLDP